MLQRFQRIRETDMKKLILITGVFLSTSLWASPMDTKCIVDAGASGYDADDWILENCERNNIFHVQMLEPDFVPWVVSEWCRYDRNVTETEHFTSLRGKGEKLVVDVTCVLYDNKRRGEVRNDL